MNAINALPLAGEGPWERLADPLWADPLPAPSIETSELIQAARAGDGVAFSHLVTFYHAAALRLAQQILHTEELAADALQDALIKVHRAMPRFQEGNFRSWLLRIVTNTCYDYLRSQRRRFTVSLDALIAGGGDMPAAEVDAATDPASMVIAQETMEALLQAVTVLPEWQRTVVILVDVQGYDYAEASAMLAVPVGTVKSRLSRARAVLRDALVLGGHIEHSRSALVR
jgi:RNA polymerase sigma-70 factor, ECF subfamily